MKIIFLDIDGVLNRFRKFDPDEDIDAIDVLFEPPLVERLNRITDATQARIVVSSSWVLDHVESYFVDAFKRAGITASVHSITDPYQPDRVARINRWLKDAAHAYDDFTAHVVIDDDKSVRVFNPNVVLTDPSKGLTERNVTKAIKILNG